MEILNPELVYAGGWLVEQPPLPPTTEIKPRVPGEELDLKKIIQADRKYDLFGTETEEDTLQKLLQSLWQSQWPQQYYVLREKETEEPIFGKKREGMYDWVVVTDVKLLWTKVVQYTINWVNQYEAIDPKKTTVWQLPLIYIIPPEEQADPDKLEQQDPQEADPDDSENNQDQNENQEPEDGDQGEQPENTESSDSEDKNPEPTPPETTSAEEKTEDDKQSESTPQEATPQSKPSGDEKDDGEEWAKEIVEAGAKKVTPEELLTLPKQEFVLAKRSSTLINEDGTEVPNASYHTVKVFDNTQWTSTVTWVAVHDGKLKYFYANEDGRVWQKKHSDYDKNRCLYWIAKASW